MFQTTNQISIPSHRDHKPSQRLPNIHDSWAIHKPYQPYMDSSAHVYHLLHWPDLWSPLRRDWGNVQLLPHRLEHIHVHPARFPCLKQKRTRSSRFRFPVFLIQPVWSKMCHFPVEKFAGLCHTDLSDHAERGKGRGWSTSSSNEGLKTGKTGHCRHCLCGIDQDVSKTLPLATAFHAFGPPQSSRGWATDGSWWVIGQLIKLRCGYGASICFHRCFKMEGLLMASIHALPRSPIFWWLNMTQPRAKWQKTILVDSPPTKHPSWNPSPIDPFPQKPQLTGSSLVLPQWESLVMRHFSWSTSSKYSGGNPFHVWWSH